jgi:hypothetical protein
MITMHVGGDIDTSQVDDEHLKRTALGEPQNGLADALVVEPVADHHRA